MCGRRLAVFVAFNGHFIHLESNMFKMIYVSGSVLYCSCGKDISYCHDGIPREA